jgi:hypothetical protein
MRTSVVWIRNPRVPGNGSDYGGNHTAWEGDARGIDHATSPHRAPIGGDKLTSVARHTPDATLVSAPRANRSTIFLKLLMATSGLVFVAFVLLHM